MTHPSDALRLQNVPLQRQPLRVTADQHPTYRRAIRWILGRKVRHRTTRYLNSSTETLATVVEVARAVTAEVA